MTLEEPTLAGALAIPFFKTVLIPLGWGFFHLVGALRHRRARRTR